MAIYDARLAVSDTFQQAILNEQIQAVEHVLLQFCQPAYLRYHNPEERIGEVHVDRWNNMFTTQPTHLQYVHRETVIEVPLIEHATLKDRLELFRYLAGPFYNCQVYNRGGGPSSSACEQLRKCFESLLRYEHPQWLQAWARHINVIDPPMTHWTENGDLEIYELSGYRSTCPINLFQVFANGEEIRSMQDIRDRSEMNNDYWLDAGGYYQWNPQHIEEPQNLVEAVKAMKLPETETPTDKDTEAFIAEIDALMAEDDTDTLPPEGTLPKSAPTG